MRILDELYITETQLDRIFALSGHQHKPKIYILDTNVIMNDPDAVFKFQDNIVMIPEIVIEELDNHKKDPGDIGYNVRQAHRNFRDMQRCGNITYGFDTPEGGIVMIVPVEGRDLQSMPMGWSKEKPDNLILWTVKNLQDYFVSAEVQDKLEVILVSNDTNMHVKADAIGLKSEFYLHERVEEDYLNYTGRGTLVIPDDVFHDFHRGKTITGEDIAEIAGQQHVKLEENKFLILQNESTMGTLLAKVRNGNIVPLVFENAEPFGIKPRNSSQRFAIEGLMMPANEIPLVILAGPAGTAKTFLTLACGLEQSMESNVYRNILITRANVEFDKDIGALPGTEEEKVNPLLRGCMDNLEILVDEKGVRKGISKETDIADKVQYLFNGGYIKTEALGFLRGRSITRKYVFIDEAQNTSISQMKGILTRVGENTKIIICGDLDQIDNPRLDRHNNGLAYALKLMAGDPMCCVLGLESKESTRSPLAARIAEKIRKDDAR